MEAAFAFCGAGRQPGECHSSVPVSAQDILPENFSPCHWPELWMIARQGWVKAISVQGADRCMVKLETPQVAKALQGKKPSWRQG